MLDFPLLTLIKQQLGGGLPLWNSYSGFGYPLVPFSALISYPPLWPLRVLSVSDAITVLDVVHFALAGVGVYLLASITGASRVGRTVGALGFVLSGFMIGHLFAGHLFELGVVGWMPWVFYAAHRLLDRPSGRAALLLGIAAGLQVLANGIGFLVFTAYPVSILLLIGIVARLRCQGLPALRLPALALLGGMAAAGIAGVILLPFAQVLGWSIRSGGLDFTGASKISLPPAALLMAFSPDAVGTGPQDTYWLDQFSRGYWHEYALYVGLVPLLAAAMACLRCRQQPHVHFYTALSVVGLLMALGRYTPCYGLAFHLLPGLDLVRVPARWLLCSTLGVAVLAGPGVDWLLAQRSGARQLLRAVRVPLLTGVALIVALLIGLQVVYMQGGNTDLQPHFADTVVPAGGRLLIFGGFLALLLACHAERLIRPRATAALLLAFTVLDLWCAASGSVRFLDPAPFYAPTAVSGLLRPDASTYRVLTIDRSMPNRQGMVDDSVYDAEDYAPVTLKAPWSVAHPQALTKGYGEISNADARGLISCFDARFAALLGISEVTTAAPFTSLRLCLPGGKSPQLTSRAAVAVDRWLLPNGNSWNPTFVQSVTYIYRNTAALPRAFLMPLDTSERMDSAALQLKTVMRPDFDGTRHLILDPSPSRVPLGLDFLQDLWAQVLRPVDAPLPTTLGQDEARVLTDTGNSLQVAVNASAPAYLVLDDVYYPGWQVWVDGRRASISRADYVLRAVPVPAGMHRIVFTYAPLSFPVGMGISVGTALLALVCLMWPLRRRVHDAASSATIPVAASGAVAPAASAGSVS